MLMSGQLSSRMTIDDAQSLRMESQQLRHNSRNIKAVSVLLKEVSDDLAVSKGVVTAVRTNRLLRIKDSMKETEK